MWMYLFGRYGMVIQWWPESDRRVSIDNVESGVPKVHPRCQVLCHSQCTLYGSIAGADSSTSSAVRDVHGILSPSDAK